MPAAHFRVFFIFRIDNISYLWYNSTKGVIVLKIMHYHKNISAAALAAVLGIGSFSSSPVHADSYDDKLDAIISDIITDDMSDTEKVSAIAKYVAEEFHYNNDDVYYQRWTEMLDYGGGDCWANTDLNCQLLGKVGIEYIRCDDSLSALSGSGHIFPVAFADGKYLRVETGSFGEKPRSWFVSEIGSVPYTYSVSDDETVFSRYYGSETDFVIPDQIDGIPVTKIGKCAFSTKQLTDFSHNNSKLCFLYWHWDFSHVEAVTIPETVKDIDNAAFMYSKLKNITIPDTVLSVGDSAFYGCEDMTEVHIGSGVSTIGEDVFGGCDNLADVYYSGSEDDWLSLTSGKDIGLSESVTIHFTTDPILGDINGNGLTDADDLALLSDFLLGKTIDSSLHWDCADINTDGSINSFDLIILRGALQ